MQKTLCGIYKIINLINGKFYIGSSKDIYKRFKDHKRELKKGQHINSHLQAAWFLYGEETFRFLIIEECKEEELIIKEQYYLDNNDWSKLYNLNKMAGTGGSEFVEIPLYLLDLKGNIINEYKSGAEIAREFNINKIDYSIVNTKSIFRKKYRIVNKEFYKENKSIILSWKIYSNRTNHLKELNSLPKYKVFKENEEYVFFTLKEISNFLNVSGETVRQILNKDVKIHLKSNYFLEIIRKSEKYRLT